MSTASSNNKEGATPYVPQIKLDRSSPVPLYFQISEPIATLINDGTLPAGTRLEDELSMAARLQVSRPTARQALQRLVDRGLLTRRRGVGTLVSPPHVHRPMELTSLLSDLTDAGHHVSTSITRYEMRAATQEEAKALGVDEGEVVAIVGPSGSGTSRSPSSRTCSPPTSPPPCRSWRTAPSTSSCAAATSSSPPPTRSSARARPRRRRRAC